MEQRKWGGERGRPFIHLLASLSTFIWILYYVLDTVLGTGLIAENNKFFALTEFTFLWKKMEGQ